MTSDTKPPPRVVNTELLTLIGLEHDVCEVTGRSGGLHRHHVLFRSHGGDDVRANILVISDILHDRYHRGDRNALFTVGAHVRDHRPDVLAYIASKTTVGYAQEWLRRHLEGTA